MSSAEPRRKVVTITLNTAFDYVVSVDKFSFPAVMRATRTSLIPSGKGVNVSRVVSGLGHPATALGFAGQSDMDRYESLASPQLAIGLLPVAGNTRTNVTIVDTARRQQTHLITTGYSISAQNIAALHQALKRSVRANDVVVISGSVPPGTPPSTIADLIENCHAAGAATIVDTGGENLRQALGAKPYLVKPNVLELEELTGAALSASEPALVEAARQTASAGPRVVVVSRGPLGVIAVCQDSDAICKASVKIDDPRAVSTIGVGSGDALVAGLAVARLEDRPLEEAIRLGVACGAAKRYTRDPGECPSDEIQSLLSLVDVEWLTP